MIVSPVDGGFEPLARRLSFRAIQRQTRPTNTVGLMGYNPDAEARSGGGATEHMFLNLMLMGVKTKTPIRMGLSVLLWWQTFGNALI